MGGPRRPDDDRGRYRPPPSPYRSAGRSARDGARPPRTARNAPPRPRGNNAAHADANPFARLAAAWRRFRERPDSPQIIAGTLLAAALLCGAMGLLLHPSTASGNYHVPQSVSGGLVGTASATSNASGTPGSILAPTATPPAAPTATSTTTPGAAIPTATPQAAATATATKPADTATPTETATAGTPPTTP